MSLYDPSELCILNVTSDRSDSWANDFFDGVRENKSSEPGRYAPDYDGTTGGGSGINLLILVEDLAYWLDACEACDLEVLQSPLKVTEGHYGDGGWDGIDLVEQQDGKLKWVE